MFLPHGERVSVRGGMEVTPMRRACIAAFVLCLSAPLLTGDIVKFADGKSIEGIMLKNA